jgi:hypothetical protein
MSRRIMYSALGSSEIQPTSPLLKDHTTAPRTRHKEILTTLWPKASRQEVVPVPENQLSRNHHPANYLEPAAFTTSKKYNTEIRLLYPYYRPSTHRFTGDPNDPGVFMKKQCFAKKHRHNEDYYAECTAQEIKRCEQISRHPHKNLAEYLGVETRKFDGEERVTRIAYERYTMDLHAFVLEKGLLRPSHVTFLLDGIKAGMQALHAMELVHCDLRPMNIFITVDEGLDEAGNAVLREVVLGDFDASVRIGEETRLKCASREWWPQDAKFGMKAGTWVDEWCFEKLGEWLNGDWRLDTNRDCGSQVMRKASECM